jgi:hypothetical protein
MLPVVKLSDILTVFSLGTILTFVKLGAMLTLEFAPQFNFSIKKGFFCLGIASGDVG